MLEKWRKARRLLHCSLIEPHAKAAVTARIEEVVGTSIRMDARSLLSDGAAYSLLLNLDDAVSLAFQDWRQAPMSLSEEFRARHEVSIVARWKESRCELHVLKPADTSKDRAEIHVTPREMEVLRLVAAGISSRGIARILNISFKTVTSHRTNLLEKFAVHDAVSLVLRAANMGLLKR